MAGELMIVAISEAFDSENATANFLPRHTPLLHFTF